jgi:hypothetical protein
MPALEGGMRAELETCIVSEVERLVPSGVAAVFRCDPADGVVVRAAAGPRWRTAEHEVPAWLRPHSRALADLVRSGRRCAAHLMLASRQGAPSEVREVVHMPLMVDGTPWGALLVLRPPRATAPAEDLWILDACARHLERALQAQDHAGVSAAGTTGA